uniref:Uncharacterized protein n=1 Tax=Solanum lycopersicum TaxID=4081 RepID=A0A3Q7GG49_SOLLC
MYYIYKWWSESYSKLKKLFYSHNMAKTLLLTVFLVATFLVISQDVVLCVSTCNNVSDCLPMVCHAGRPMCVRGICRCHPEVTGDKIHTCNGSSECIN